MRYIPSTVANEAEQLLSSHREPVNQTVPHQNRHAQTDLDFSCQTCGG